MSHIQHLSKDKLLAKIIDKKNPLSLSTKKNIYLSLCFSIMSQQLSTKVAAIIHERFLALYKNKKPSLQQITSTPFSVLKSIGLSDSKTNYLLNVCDYFIANKLTDSKLHKMSDENITEMLTQIKGVGRWTSEMVLMFSMGREDVFAVDDLGIQQQMCKLYNIDMASKKEMKLKMQQVAENWKPYRTYACRYLWDWKDAN